MNMAVSRVVAGVGSVVSRVGRARGLNVSFTSDCVSSLTRRCVDGSLASSRLHGLVVGLGRTCSQTRIRTKRTIKAMTTRSMNRPNARVAVHAFRCTKMARLGMALNLPELVRVISTERGVGAPAVSVCFARSGHSSRRFIEALTGGVNGDAVGSVLSSFGLGCKAVRIRTILSGGGVTRGELSERRVSTGVLGAFGGTAVGKSRVILSDGGTSSSFVVERLHLLTSGFHSLRVDNVGGVKEIVVHHSRR